jgi:hypothetical protein
MLREIRDALYRLSHPSDFSLQRSPVQVIATAHTPYMLDLFREHPEEVIITQKQGPAATFERLSDLAFAVENGCQHVRQLLKWNCKVCLSICQVLAT